MNSQIQLTRLTPRSNSQKKSRKKNFPTPLARHRSPDTHTRSTNPTPTLDSHPRLNNTDQQILPPVANGSGIFRRRKQKLYPAHPAILSATTRGNSRPKHGLEATAYEHRLQGIESDAEKQPSCKIIVMGNLCLNATGRATKMNNCKAKLAKLRIS